MATRSLRVRRLISPQWGQSDPPSARFVAIRVFDWLYAGEAIERGYLYPSEAHRNTAGEEKACPLQSVDHEAS
ncbi:hypothetical protein G5714_010864 [Onychostoma macrolepis]|uniref:Uncharacterized protein n=1 Tax=Onychostoma macrolepis TaxID=369639 RepID=A0A7J6CNF8_9TELE|nr:hypothetical protein G5714_010864 [Onychostoma macrolepis]